VAPKKEPDIASKAKKLRLPNKLGPEKKVTSLLYPADLIPSVVFINGCEGVISICLSVSRLY
tara:strand:+ start:1789 stop:1974 length:186 start_codon:yes stop_codon:yes gene_type:complete